jgi:hypothetical protein
MFPRETFSSDLGRDPYKASYVFRACEGRIEQKIGIFGSHLGAKRPRQTEVVQKNRRNDRGTASPREFNRGGTSRQLRPQ